MEKYLELKLHNLINLRNIYAAVVMALTGCSFGLLFDVTIFKIISLVVCLIINFSFMVLYKNANKSISKILQVMRGK